MKQQSTVPVSLEMLVASEKECLLVSIKKEKNTTEKDKYVRKMILAPVHTYLAIMASW